MFAHFSFRLVTLVMTMSLQASSIESADNRHISNQVQHDPKLPMDEVCASAAPTVI